MADVTHLRPDGLNLHEHHGPHHEHDGHGHMSEHHAHPDHNHDHGHKPRARPRARPRVNVVGAGAAYGIGVFGAHSHDAADQIDNALEADSRGRRALWISLAVLSRPPSSGGRRRAVGSVALLGDTLHNVADALTAIPLLIAFTLARRPGGERYTYGYGRRDLAGLFVVAMITLSAVVAGCEAVRRLIDPQPVSPLPAVAGARLAGFVGNELVARYRIRVGRQIGSCTGRRRPSCPHGRVHLARRSRRAAGVAAGWRWADPVIGLVITLAVWASYARPSPGGRPAHGRGRPAPRHPGAEGRSPPLTASGHPHCDCGGSATPCTLRPTSRPRSR